MIYLCNFDDNTETARYHSLKNLRPTGIDLYLFGGDASVPDSFAKVLESAAREPTLALIHLTKISWENLVTALCPSGQAIPANLYLLFYSGGGITSTQLSPEMLAQLRGANVDKIIISKPAFGGDFPADVIEAAKAFVEGEYTDHVEQYNARNIEYYWAFRLLCEAFLEEPPLAEAAKAAGLELNRPTTSASWFEPFKTKNGALQTTEQIASQMITLQAKQCAKQLLQNISKSESGFDENNEDIKQLAKAFLESDQT